MRVTNNMITGNTKYNINANKVLVDKYNTQMTTHKKINKASDNPVIAIRSLRMQTNLSHLTQYLDNNIEDANSWIDITETALTNMKDLLTRIRTQCVNGSADLKEAKDRDTILKELQALQEQVYTEGNADYAGRTVFTGYRTNCQFTFKDDEQDTKYEITETFTYEDLKEQRYYYGVTEVPVDTTAGDCTTEIGTQAYNRLRLAYDKIDDLIPDSTPTNIGTIVEPAPGGVKHYPTQADWEADNGGATPVLKVGEKVYIDDTKTLYQGVGSTSITVDTKTHTDSTGAAKYPEKPTVTVYATEQDWIYARTNLDNTVSELGDQDVVLIKDTGELIFGKEIGLQYARDKVSFKVEYAKTGFAKNEPRPEYYFDCKMHTLDMAKGEMVEYTKQEQKIYYAISAGITLPVNTEACEVFGTDIGRDVSEMIDIVSAAINANDKVTKIKQLMEREQFSSEEDQKVLQTYLDAAKKEADYANDHMQKTFSQYITNFDNYFEKVNIGITNLGSLQNRLDMTQNRVENQKTTVELLKSNNEDRDISDIIIDYYAAYNAYTASLTAASKVGQQTLLNYL